MENEIKSSIPPVQPLPQISAPVPTISSSYWPKTLLFVALGLIVIAISIFIGIQIGKYQTPDQQPVAIPPTISPTPTNVIPTSLPSISATATPTSDQTTNWKTYTNDEIGFSFKYPQTWEIKKETSPRIVSLIPNSEADSLFLAFHKNISNIPQWLTDNQAGETIKTVTIGNNEFSVIKGGLLYLSQEYAVILPSKGLLRFVIEPFPNESIDTNLITAILSTFKQID